MAGILYFAVVSKPTAILYFSRSVKEEAKSKNLHSNRKKNLRLFRAMDDHAQSILSACNLPIIFAERRVQKGDTFGEKLASSIAFAFSKGYQNLIVVGNDTLGLNRADISKAHEGIKQGRSTIGPSTDGGVYLFTVTQNDFELDKIREIPWCGAQVSRVLKNIYADDVQVLESKTDVDNGSCWEAAFAECNYNDVVNKVLHLLFLSVVKNFELINSFQQKLYFFSAPFRGPPAILIA